MPDDPVTPDLSALATRYVDLWQKQVAAAAADPDLAAGFAAMLRIAGSGAGLFDPARLAALAAETSLGHTDRGSAPGTGAGGTAPRDRGDELERIARRLDAIDARLAALESRLDGGGGSPSPAPRRRRA